ncbi:MAG TPA: ATP-binding protein, partial [Flavobacteriaceae bacterium]|nr:ATP-binding protein [Flavobacteriaceae bacterium]
SNLIAYSNYALAKLNYEFENFEQAKKRLKAVLKGKNTKTNQYQIALSHILLSKINIQEKQIEEAKAHLEMAGEIISTLETSTRQDRISASNKILTLSEENSKQQRSLEFNQLAIILGVTMILVLSLLTLAFFKNSYIRAQTTYLLRTKNKELTEEKNLAEKATMAKTQFLSTITHELRTPIYAVTGLTHLLLETNPSKEQKEHLNSLKFSGEHLLALINNILDFNKLEAKKVTAQPANFVLRHKIENILTALTKSAKDKNNKLHLEIDENLPEKVIGDHVKLSQVLINLVSNAIRFTENGDVWVRLNLVNTSENHLLINFEIEDNGVGIPEGTKEKIFENFTQGSDEVNNKYGGTGLGLPIVKGILQVLGGEIQVESTLDVGSKFYFSLKFQKAKDTETTEEDDAKEKAANLKKWQGALNGKKILIVEDNKINQMITHKILAKHHVVCELADNGEIAVEKAKSNQYDLILMDVHMPIMNGIDATREIRKIDQKTPIVALTAVALDDDLEGFLKNGFNDVIPKPYKMELFFQKIHDEITSVKNS